MNFIRDNIVKIGILLFVAIIIIVVAVACSNRQPNISEANGYLEMENKLQNAAIRYVKKNPTLLPKTTDKSRKIQMDTLINNKLLNEFHAQEDKNVTCTGYVEIIKKYEDSDSYRYTPYIKCGKYYQTKTIADYIKDNEEVVTTGEGLYAQGEKYYYKGEYPNNYIMLGNRLYRIIEITEDNNLKVISTQKTENSYVWDNRFNTEKNDYYGINVFSKSRLKESLEALYSNRDESKGEVYFSDTERDYIIEHDFCVGRRSESDVSISSDSECKETDSLHIGTISLNEYYRVSTAAGCTAINRQECNNYNYLYSIRPGNTKFMTFIGNTNNTYTYYSIYYGELQTRKTYTEANIYPVFYMDENIIYKSGSGTSEDPYIVR